MKLIKIFRRFKPRFLIQIQNDLYLKTLFTLFLLTSISFMVWWLGPHIAWHDYFPLLKAEKRIYVIIFIFLAWLLKFLLIDLDAPNPFQYKDLKIQKKLIDLLNRFQGARHFLDKTKVSRHGKTIRLYQLPLYLLIGPTQAGKTSLLANSGANFILHRQFQHHGKEMIKSSETCDWWLTRDIDIIDVPGSYLTAQPVLQKNQQKPILFPIMWHFFLRLLKKTYGKNRIDGILITLALPEIMRQDQQKKYLSISNEILQRLSEIQKIFKEPIPCYLLITKCDLLPGFNEFFTEMTNEEIAQAWGVSLPEVSEKSLEEDYAEGFDALIRKLNQQLLSRLHHERNPNVRPAIKDFPFQIERLKETGLSFIKKFAKLSGNLSLQGIYLNSATQRAYENTLTTQDETHTTALQLVKMPEQPTRAFFIKSFLTQTLANTATQAPFSNSKPTWQKSAAYVCSVTLIGAAALFLGKDFEQGIKHTYAIQNNLTDYQLTIQPIQDPDEHLRTTLAFLNTLQKSTKKSDFKIDLAHLLTFYSHQSQQKANEVYQQALLTVLIPEVKNYLGEYLKNPVNKNTGYVYAAFKAYLMLGDPSHFQSDYVTGVTNKILPKSFSNDESHQLARHLLLAFKYPWQTHELDQSLVQDSRKYFLAMPSFQLGFIILKNMNDNNSDSEINLGVNTKAASLISNQNITLIPNMFTGKAFYGVLSQETALAADEALSGNWVLGNTTTQKNNELIATLVQQLRSAYVTNYITLWEGLLTNVDLALPKTLAEMDNIIIDLISNDSPLLKLLRAVHDNTYFEPIASNSQKLQRLGLLVDKKTATSQNQLFQIFAGLQSLHQYVQTVLSNKNTQKAAFHLVSTRMQHKNGPDPITQLRIIAESAPEPVQSWLQRLADHTWRFLMAEAGSYIDISWHEQVIAPYVATIANRYPFNTKTDQEVALDKFIAFFGNPGIVFDFYNQYLSNFVDNTTQDWRFKNVDHLHIPFSEDSLRQIQHAMRIHKTFFPNNDNKLNIEFALQAHQLGKNVKQVKLNMNDREFTDSSPSKKETHMLAWPSNSDIKMTSIELFLKDNKTIRQQYPGAWGWFKLVNQAFDSVITKKQLLINLSLNENPAKYSLFIDEQHNPFISLNLKHFTFPDHLLNET